MLFLVDYENVGNAGLKGCGYLNVHDHLILFYSETTKKAERRMLEQITSSGCVFEICKLCKTGKNALDFYIVSKLGELIGKGYNGISIIVSKDGGFQAVRDYWEKKSTHKVKVFVSPCIEDGIASGNENNERTRELQQLRENITIGGYYSAYTEKMRIKEILKNLFAGTEYESMIDEIQDLIEGEKRTAKMIYLGSLHTFGKKNGLAIYHKIKTCSDL